MFLEGWSFGVDFLVDLLLDCFLFAVWEGFALDHLVFFGIEDLLLDVLMRGKREVLFSYFLLHNSPVLFSLV